MTKHILTIGLNDKDTKLQKFDIITSYKLVEAVLKQHTDGYTIYETRGGYKHDDGTFVTETSLRVELLFTDTNTIKLIANAIKSPLCLNQESIAYEKITTKGELL
jgi:hypothetical protein